MGGPSNPPGKGTTRLKVSLNTKTPLKWGDGEAFNLVFSPVYTGSDENKQFFAATPGGTLQFYTVNKAVADQFQIGHEYYVDISPAV